MFENYLPLILLGLLVYMVVGILCLFPLIDRMSSYKIYLNKVLYSSSTLEILLWPHVVYFFTRPGIQKDINANLHARWPWAYGADGTEYSPSEQKEKLNHELLKGKDSDYPFSG